MSDEQEAEAADAEEPEEAAAERVEEEGPGDAAEEPTAEGEDEEAQEAEPDEGGLQEGDFVSLQYTIRTAEDGTLVDTTEEPVAEEEGIDVEDQEFGPRTVVLGAGHVFEAVESELYGKDVGATGTVPVSAADAFGEHDSEQVRTVSADRIPEDSRHPGAHVDIDGQHGHVETIIGGRARVDFNHPLAGEDVEYEYEVLDVVEDRLERAQALVGVYVDVDLDMAIETEEEEQAVYDDEGEEEGTETVEVETLTIEATPQLAMNQQWLFSKQQIAQELIDRVGVERVVVREVLEGSGGFGGLGGMDLEAALEDVDEDIDTDDIVEELEEETDFEADELEAGADVGDETEE